MKNHNYLSKKSLRMALLLCLLCGGISMISGKFVTKAFTNKSGFTTALTPVDAKKTGRKWEVRLAKKSGLAYNSTPVLVDKSIYVVCEDILSELDLSGNVVRTYTLTASMNSICRMAYEDGRLYIPLAGGKIDCIDCKDWSLVWTSREFGSQSLTSVTLSEDHVYAGTGNQNGCFYALDKKSGETVWTYRSSENDSGYYWSGAVVTGANTLLFAGDDGVLVSHSLDSEKVLDTFDLSKQTGSKAMVRAAIIYDETTDAYYTTSNNGYIHRITLDDREGTFAHVESVFIGDNPDKTVNCTCTPSVYRGRLYVGGFYDSAGIISVIDCETMTRIYSIQQTGMKEVKSMPLICAGGQDTTIYVTQNAIPGGVYYFRDSQTTTESTLVTLFEPENHPQYCIFDVVAGEDGTLYYSNDSGYLFAIQEGYASPSKTQKPADQTVNTARPYATPKVTKSPKKIIPKPPTSIRYSVRKKGKTYRVTLRWKKGKNAVKTKLVLPGKKTILTKKSKITLTLKKKNNPVKLYSISKTNTPGKAKKITWKVKS